MHYFRSLALLAVAGLLVVAGGCKPSKRSGPTGVKVGLSLADASTPYAQALRKSAETFAKKRGFELIVEDAQNKASEQTRAVEQFLQKNVNAIIIRPVDAKKIGETLKKASSSNVYVVAVDENIPDADVASFVEPNQELAGKLCADYLGSQLTSGGEVAIVGAEGSGDEKVRTDAFKEYLKEKHAGVRVVTTVKAGADEASQRSAVEKLLKSHPSLGGIFTLSDQTALVAVEAVKAAGLKTRIVSYGGLPQAVDELKKSGSPLEMIVATFPQDVGKQAARGAWRIISNKQQEDHVALRILPLTQSNSGSYPGWDGEVPRSLSIPWKSDLSLEATDTSAKE
jgi:ribose transport system substrate-binding protein